jgi:zinc/manganese transport system substrate-binding protein
MPNCKTLIVSALLSLAYSLPATAEETRTKVVATFSIIGDMVARIGGDQIELTTLVGPGGDTHVFRPTPMDAKAVGSADVLILNGLEFEGWLKRLIESAEFSGTPVVATAGVKALAYEEAHGDHDDHGKHEGRGADKHHDDHEKEAAKHDSHDKHGKHEKHEEHEEHAGHEGHHHGVFDPHAWHSLVHAVTYVDNITAALAKANPTRATTFYKNRAAYVAELNALDSTIRKITAKLPDDRRTIVTSHDAFQYFGHEYGLTFLAPQGLSTESEASAKDVAKLITQMREQGIAAVFMENLTDPRLIQQIASETGAAIGGTLYTGALSGPDGPAPTYLEMMRHNLKTLTQALKL